MNGRLILRVVLALLMVAVIIVIFRSASGPKDAVEAAAPPRDFVAYAATDLPQGLLIRPQDISWKELPAKASRENFIIQDSATATDLVGAVVRTPIAAHRAISTVDVVLPSSPGFLSAALKPDMRAVSVSIDEVSGNAGLILPGDYVDLILTQRLGGKKESNQRIVSETVLSNVRVIAVGRTIRVDRSTSESKEVMASAKARTTTLEVRPKEAEVVSVAARLGDLSLALRSLATLQRPGDQPDATATAQSPDTSHPVWAEDVSTARRIAAAGSPKKPVSTLPKTVHVIHGSADAEKVQGEIPRETER